MLAIGAVVAGALATSCGAAGQSRDALYFHYDRVGSVVLASRGGAAVEERSYRVFGSERGQRGATSTDYGFAGKPLDGSTALLDFGARYYDARRARWIATDPLLRDDPRGAHQVDPWSNGYSYGADRPTVFSDADGRVIQLVGATSKQARLFELAMEHAARSPKAMEVLNGLSGKNVKIVFLPNDVLSNVHLLHEGTGTSWIGWNPTIGLVDPSDRGHIMSPTEALFHELGHAFDPTHDERTTHETLFDEPIGKEMGGWPRRVYVPGDTIRTFGVDSRKQRGKTLLDLSKESDRDMVDIHNGVAVDYVKTVASGRKAPSYAEREQVRRVASGRGAEE